MRSTSTSRGSSRGAWSASTPAHGASSARCCRPSPPPAIRRPARCTSAYRAHRAVRELVEHLAATKPLVLVLDDFHWADSASVDLVAALLHRPPAAGVLLALAARPRQLPGPLQTALERAHRAGALTRVELGALTREQAGELLGRGDADPVTAALYQETGGNPFYLEQLPGRPRIPPPATATSCWPASTSRRWCSQR